MERPRVLGIGIIKARQDQDAVTPIFSNVFDQTRVIDFIAVDRNKADISLSKKKVEDIDHVLKERFFQVGLHPIQMLKDYVKKKGGSELVNELIQPDEMARELYDVNNEHMIRMRAMSIEEVSQRPWGRNKTVKLFVSRMADIIADLLNGVSLKEVFKNRGKGIDYDSFIHLVKRYLFFKGHRQLPEILEVQLFRTKRKLEQVRAVKQAILALHGQALSAQRIIEYI